MGKRDRRYPNGDSMATCSRCGAPASVGFRGGRLIPVKGVKHFGQDGRRRHRVWQHADPQFCRTRIPTMRRTPTSTVTYRPRPQDIR